MKLTKKNREILELLGFKEDKSGYWKFDDCVYVYLPRLKSFQDLSNEMLMDNTYSKHKWSEFRQQCYEHSRKVRETWTF